MAAARVSGSPTARAQAAYAGGLAIANGPGRDAVREGLALLDESTALASAAGSPWMRCFALTESCWLRARLEDVGPALVGYREVVETWFQSGDWANQWLSLRQLAGVLATVGRDEEAAVLFGAVASAGARTALPFGPADALDIDALGTQVDGRLGSGRAVAHRQKGARLRDEAVVAIALEAIDAILLSGQ